MFLYCFENKNKNPLTNQAFKSIIFDVSFNKITYKFYPLVFFIVITWEKASENIKNLKIGGECNKEPIGIFKMGGNVNLKEQIGGNVMWNFQM